LVLSCNGWLGCGGRECFSGERGCCYDGDGVGGAGSGVSGQTALFLFFLEFCCYGSQVRRWRIFWGLKLHAGFMRSRRTFSLAFNLELR
jgi:hypothetical protein